MIKQMLIRVAPRGYCGNVLEELNSYLEKGWVVKFITPIGEHFHDYIIEKETDEWKKEK